MEPYTTGIIMNLGTTGHITNTASDNGCAGIMRSIRDGGVMVNCYSTVDLNSQKDAGGITWTVKSGGTVENCYYKGKITTTNNYAIGIATSGSKVKNCYYQLESGSTSLANNSGNPNGGTSAA